MRQATDGPAPVLVWATLVALVAIVGWSEPRAGTAPAARLVAPGPALGDERACAAYQGTPTGWPAGTHAGMVPVPAGTFRFGSDRGYPDERPADGARVPVAAFWIDRTEVTIAQFAAFVRATGYVTDAERQGGAVVFRTPTEAELAARPYAWWTWVAGADWRHPGGPGTDVAGLAHHPVTFVTRADALAYARWLGRDLPTEAEWEYAAKAGQDGPALDAAPRDAAGRPTANYWQGAFPALDTAEDGHAGLAPVGCYAANAWGLHDTIGNAWEWTKDAYTGPRQPHLNGDTAAAAAATGGVAAHDAATVIKGGSFLCSPDFCVRYRASARESQEADLATAHLGFRTVRRDAAS